MTPNFFNSSSNDYSPYPTATAVLHHDHDQDHHQFLSPNNSQPSSSNSNSLTTHLFLNPTTQFHQHQDDNYGSQAYSEHRIGNNHDQKRLNFSTWNKSEIMKNDENQVKWMSSKMRVMLKMKKSEPVNLNTYSSSKREDHKLLTSSPMEETDNSSNSTSSNNNIPIIRVCSDCNTTKTPLWRSGPQGPKSLCNACGIRQRKARRAMAVAAAEDGNSNGLIDRDRSIVMPLKVTKTQHKDHKKLSNGHVTKYKKRQHSKQIITTTPPASPSPSLSPSPSSSSPARKNCVEEFLVSLSKNLTFYRVFPQDEKEAAILLMALSCGYAHET